MLYSSQAEIRMNNLFMQNICRNDATGGRHYKYFYKNIYMTPHIFRLLKLDISKQYELFCYMQKDELHAEH